MGREITRKRIMKVSAEALAFICLMICIIFVPTMDANAAGIPGGTPASKKVSKRQTTMNKGENSFLHPDFAYPQTVSANALIEYNRAMRDGNPINALKAAIQMDVSQLMISTDSVNRQLQRFNELSRTLQSPYNKLAALLEAKLLSSVYQSDSYTFDHRKLPLTKLPDNVLEWSQGMFAQQIDSLVSVANSDPGLGEIPISEIGSLLIHTDAAKRTGMSVLDFISLESKEVLERIGDIDMYPLRFGDSTGKLSPVDKCGLLKKTILQDAIARNDQKGNSQLAALFSWDWCMSNQYNAIKYRQLIDQYYHKYKDTEWGANFVVAYANSLLNRSENYDYTIEEENKIRGRQLDILTSYLKKFPKAPYIESVNNQMNNLMEKNVELNVSAQVLPGKALKVKVEGQNIYSFYINVYRIPDNFKRDRSYYTLKELAGNMELVVSHPVTFKGAMPDIYSDTVSLPGLDPGRYIVVATTGKSSKSIIGYSPRKSLNVIGVSKFSYICSNSWENGKTRLYIVDGENMKPVKGVRVDWKENIYRGTPKTGSLTTDADGCVIIPCDRGSFVAALGANKINGDFYSGYHSDDIDYEKIYGTILADLSIYKPGQEIGFVAMLYKGEDHQVRELAGENVELTLRNANNQKVDSLLLVTDRFGRVSGKFKIPTTGLLGQYQLCLLYNRKQVALNWINVSEYKQPTFMVETGGAGGHYELGDTLKLTGRALTYTGIGLAGAKVDYKITYSPWRYFWYSYYGQQSCGGSTMTDADGEFVIELPTETLRDTPYVNGIFTLQVTVTDAAGETHEAPLSRFSLISDKVINADIPSKICADDLAVPLSVRVSDVCGYPVQSMVYYSISEAGRILKSGEFMSPDFKIDFSEIPSGEYEFVFSLDKNFNTVGKKNDPGYVSQKVIIWRTNDKQPPVESILWTPITNISMPKDKKSVKIPVGSSYQDSYLLVTEAKNGKEITRTWVKVNGDILEYEVEAPEPNKRTYLSVIGGHDLKMSDSKITVVPFDQTRQLEIATETFRDKLTPGEKENWKFKLSVDGQPVANRAVMAVMSNKALNAIAPFAWHLNPYEVLYWRTPLHYSVKNPGSSRNTFSIDISDYITGNKPFMNPEWNFYNYEIYPYYMSYSVRGRSLGAGIMENAPVMMAADGSDSEDGATEVEIEVKKSYKAMARSEAAVSANQKEEAGENPEEINPKEELRPVEMPLAFFMPDMVTDQDGVAVVDFEVPQFNGTWQFQIAGVSEDMRGGVKILDAVATKKVMVQMNPPRFLRTGDIAQISATIFNNSETNLPIAGKFEIVDLVSGKVLTEDNYSSEDIVPAGQRVITMSWNVPDDLSSVLLRVYAEGGNHRDGEQTVVAILPSSTPILETRPFYTAPSEGIIKVEIPKDAKDARVTLQYCGNPIWECVTALPQIITPKSQNALAQIDALYGVSIANGLIKRYPVIAEALKTFAAPENASDSTLVSKLRLNQDIKNVALENTPWVNNASNETLRMQSLIEYVDSERAEQAIRSYMDRIAKLQNNDGGISWCDNMPSSEFITGRVLLHFAMLKSMGFLPEGGNRIAVKGFSYCDQQIMESWVQTGKKYFDLSELLNYMYVKSFFPEVKDTYGFDLLRKEAMSKLSSKWRDLGIYDKATAVTLEFRMGNRKLAGDILESLRQFACVSKEKGMWFDNLRGVWSAWNPLITTAQALEAYSEVSPENKNVDLLRQWLLMSKQTQDWGDMQGTAEVVYAILSTGSDWTEPSQNAVVKIGNNEINVPKRAKLTDSFTITLDNKELKKDDIIIEKHSAGPAWGGVVLQTVMPILNVKADIIPELSIEKNVYAITEGSAGTEVRNDNFKVGDRVRITLTITCDRDMNYVALMDSRSACLEPAEQLSGYMASDGVWFYRETRNEGTNLFIPFLSKGTHVISYECFVDRAGTYSLGIASIQSQYAPTLAAHSSGKEIIVEK